MANTKRHRQRKATVRITQGQSDGGMGVKALCDGQRVDGSTVRLPGRSWWTNRPAEMWHQYTSEAAE